MHFFLTFSSILITHHFKPHPCSELLITVISFHKVTPSFVRNIQILFLTNISHHQLNIYFLRLGERNLLIWGSGGCFSELELILFLFYSLYNIILQSFVNKCSLASSWTKAELRQTCSRTARDFGELFLGARIEVSEMCLAFSAFIFNLFQHSGLLAHLQLETPNQQLLWKKKMSYSLSWQGQWRTVSFAGVKCWHVRGLGAAERLVYVTSAVQRTVMSSSCPYNCHLLFLRDLKYVQKFFKHRIRNLPLEICM